MKKVWKGLAAAASAAAIAATGFVGASSAFADDTQVDVTTNKEITLKGVAAGDTYEAYKLLKVVGATQDANGDVTSVAYNVEPKYRDVLKAALELGADATDNDIITTINRINKAEINQNGNEVVETEPIIGAGDTTVNGGDSPYVRDFGARVMAAIEEYNKTHNPKITADATETAAENESTIKFTLLPGYYLFNQTNNAKPDTNTDSSYIINTAVVANREIQVKNGTVTLTKKVQDEEVPNYDPKGGEWNDSADYDLGDTVPFQLTGTLPANLASYKTFKYIFHDWMSKGLTRNNDVKVYAVNGNAETEITDKFTTTAVTEYKGDDASDAKAQYFTTGIEDLLALNTDEENPLITKDTKIVVRYTAILNNDAKIGEAGNPNEALIEFSNNSDHNGNGDTEKTPEDKVTVFTYQLNVIKTFSTGAPDDNDLPQFTLYKMTENVDGGESWQEYTNSKGSKAEKVVVKKINDDKTISYVINWEGLDEGDYKLVETHVPGGFVKADDIEFYIQATHDVNSDDPKLTVLESNFPQGKTVLSTGAVTGTILNKAGSELPSTGGMGTVVLYTVGGLIVLIAGVGLAVALRRRQA